jgi:nitroreductase
MEFKEVVGNRRSIRYFQPWRPVEKEKIQVMLEAARLASRAVNAPFYRVVVMERDELSLEQRDSLRTPTTTTDLDLAPLYMFWFIDPTAPNRGPKTLKQLVDVGALNASHGWSHAYVDEVIFPHVLQPLMKTPEAAIAVAACEAGFAMYQAMLAAVDEGLGVCLHAFTADKIKEVIKPPDHLIPIWVLLVGYPAEDPLTGGQRPREALSETCFWGSFEHPIESDPKVVAYLEEKKMIQPKAPAPWRMQEVAALSRMFGLPE